MRRFVLRSLFLVAFVAAIGCGGDEEPTENSGAVEPPENPERALPTMGGPQDEDFEEPPPPDEYVREDYVSGGGTVGECCPVVFAFAPGNSEEVEEALLRGDLFPLNTADGVPLTETDGVWSGEACLAPDQFGTYYYELGLRSAFTDELFLSITYNPFAPTTTAAGEVVNVWVPEDDCASLDVSVHAQTGE